MRRVLCARNLLRRFRGSVRTQGESLRTQDPLSSDEGNSSAEDMSTLSSDAGVCGRRTPCLRTRATRLRTIAELERERDIYIYVDLFFGGGQAVTAQLIVVSICAAGKGEAACTPPGNLTEKSELD